MSVMFGNSGTAGTSHEQVMRTPKELENVKRLLASQNLTLDDDVEYTIGIFQNGKLVGTGSVSGKVIKCVAVEKSLKGSGLSSQIVTTLVQYLTSKGVHHIFIFSKPESAEQFKALGFREVARSEPYAVLLETGPWGVEDYKKELKKQFVPGKNICGIVVNCNPFTIGHRHLIKTASKECDVVHVFVVREDLSLFPYYVRLKLIKDGVAGLENVRVHAGDDYIISRATFPRYFTRKTDFAAAQAALDLEVFATHIAPTLGIKKRYVGNEPYCPVTQAYNEAMKRVLTKHGIVLVVVQRLKLSGEAISASQVRQLIHEGRLDETEKLVPKTTFKFLKSKEAAPIVKKIKTSTSRH